MTVPNMKRLGPIRFDWNYGLTVLPSSFGTLDILIFLVRIINFISKHSGSYLTLLLIGVLNIPLIYLYLY